MRPFKTQLETKANHPKGWISRVSREGFRLFWKEVKVAARNFFAPLFPPATKVEMDRIIVGVYHPEGSRDFFNHDTIADHLRDEFGSQVDPQVELGSLSVELTHRCEGQVTLLLDRTYPGFDYKVYTIQRGEKP